MEPQKDYEHPRKPTCFVTYSDKFFIFLRQSPHVCLPQSATGIEGADFTKSGIPNCEPDSSVSMVSGYGLDDRAIEVRSPAEAKWFFLQPLSRPALGSTQPPTGGSFTQD
jgi:hypothetical protein